MALPIPLLFFCVILLAFTPTTVAHPLKHSKLKGRLLHRNRDLSLHRAAGSNSGQSQTQRESIVGQFTAEVALQAATLEGIASITLPNILKRGEPHQDHAVLPGLPFTNAELQEKLNAIDSTIQSLVALFSDISTDLDDILTSTVNAIRPDVLLSTGYSAALSTTSIPTTSTHAALATMPTVIVLSTGSNTPTTSILSTLINLEPATTRTLTVSSTASTMPTSAPSTDPGARGGLYAFNPMSNRNVAVYYGQTTQTSSVPLSEVCADPDLNIVILAFVPDFFGPGGWPTLNMGPNCWAASAAQSQAGATGLIDCVSDGFAAVVQQCQDAGKKVMLSLGGAQGYSDTTIPNDLMAAKLADTLWNLFLGGIDNSTTSPLRPFGNIALDGIDIDNESGTTAGMATLISTLRTKFQENQFSKSYFLSAAPQCPRPDASIPLISMQTTLDFIWVQFYNNPVCNLNLGQSFLTSLGSWSSDLSANDTGFVNIGNGVTAPRLFIGAPSFSSAGSGYANASEFQNMLESVSEASFSNFGGVMFWDGAFGEESAATDGSSTNETFMQIVKEVLD